MKQMLLAALVLIAIIGTAGSCVQPETQTAGGQQSIMKINGRPVSADEVLKSPWFRMPFQQYLVLQTLTDEVAALKLNIDEDLMQERIDSLVQAAVEQNKTEDELLREQKITFEEFKKQVRTQLYFDALVESRINITEEDLQKRWEEEGDRFVTMYMNTNKLADSERSSITYEDVKEDIRMFTLDDRRAVEQQKTWEMLVKKTDVSFTGITDPDVAELVENLIINFDKQAIIERELPEENKAEEETEAAADETVAEDEDAGDETGVVEEAEPAVEETGDDAEAAPADEEAGEDPEAAPEDEEAGDEAGEEEEHPGNPGDQ